MYCIQSYTINQLLLFHLYRTPILRTPPPIRWLFLPFHLFPLWPTPNSKARADAAAAAAAALPLRKLLRRIGTTPGTWTWMPGLRAFLSRAEVHSLPPPPFCPLSRFILGLFFSSSFCLMIRGA